MTELVQWIQENWGKSLKTSSIVILVLLILDKVGTAWYSSHEQRRLESKIDALLRERGIEWNGNEGIDISGVMNSSKSWLSSWAKHMYAQRVKKQSKRGMDMTPTKTQIATFLVTAAGFIKDTTGYNFPNEYIDLASTIVWIAFAVWGIWHSPNKQAKQDDEMFLTDGGE
jgi:hypothetical protein